MTIGENQKPRTALVPGTGFELEAFSGRERVSTGDERESAVEIPSVGEGLPRWCREQDLNLHAFYGTGS
jgi:hypothetical protein